MRIRSLLLSMALGLAVVAGAGTVAAPSVAAAQGYTETGATTYTLDPAHGVLHVSVTMRVRNTTPDTQTTVSCPPTTCTRTTRWYLTTATIWVENEATAINASSGGARLAVEAGVKGSWYRKLTVTYPPLYYGRSRTVVVTYDIRGGAPRSNTELRLLRAYADFCVIANGADSGSVQVSVPAGYRMDTTGTSLVRTVVGNGQVYSSGRIGDTSTYWTCLSGTNDAGYRVEDIKAPDGRAIHMESWPEDARWTRAVKAEIDKGVPAIETLIGRSLPGTAPITVREDATGTEYAGFYDADTNTVTVGEDYAQPLLVEHELAHVWFNLSAFKDRWLDEGSAEWAGRTTSGEERACLKPAAGTEVTLSDWKFLTPKSTQAERDAVLGQYETACYIVSTIATVAGERNTTAALAALFDGRDPYAADPSARRDDKVATWQDWLDAMDELGLRPAGASGSLASDLLLAYGVTTDRALLAQREVARTAYHQLVAQADGWVVPPAVRAPMAAWDFTTASAAIAAAGRAWTLSGETDRALPGIDARHGPVAAAWAAARNVTDLTDAGTKAQAQLDAAKDVAATIAALSAPLDTIQQIGVLGASVPSLDPAVTAVRSGDTATATRLAASARDWIRGLETAGQERLASLIGAVVVLLILVIVLLLARRARRRRAATMAAVSATPPVAMPGPVATPGPVAPADDPPSDWPQPPPPPPPIA